MHIADTSLVIGNSVSSGLDSLRLAGLDLAIARAEKEAEASAFLSRMIPDISLSASFGISQLAFIDPVTAVPYILPRDSYRLSLSLSVSGLFDGSAHDKALLKVQEATLNKEIVRMEQQEARTKLAAEIRSLEIHREELRQERLRVERILQFRKMQFDEGKIDFESLMQAELRLIRLDASITQLTLRLAGCTFKPE